MKLVADDKIPFLRGVFEAVGCEVVYAPGARITPELVRDADGLLTRTRTRCDEALLAGSRVRFIASATIGFDHLDTAYLARAGIRWTNAPGCNAGSVRQYVAGVLVRLPLTLPGRTLGVIGVGNVGKRVAAMARALGMNVLLCDPFRRDAEPDFPHCELPELLRASEVVTLHTPLTRDGRYPTFQLADAAFLAALKPGAFLINTGRGEVCSGSALLAELRRGRIGGAVLDVWEQEPEINRELLKQVLFGTPHIAGYSADGKAAGTRMAVRATARFFQLPELFDFEPTGVPEPENPELGALSPEEAIQASYDLEADSNRLKAAPERFEELRGNYPVRREFEAFRAPRATALGFRG